MNDEQLKRLLQQRLPVVPLEEDPAALARLDARLALLEAELAEPPPKKPGPWKAIVALAALVAILVGLWLWLGEGESESPPPEPPPPEEEAKPSPPGKPLLSGEQ